MLSFLNPADKMPSRMKSRDKLDWIMIAYDLQCRNGHCFEGWFEDEKAYLQQKQDGLLACPTCNDSNVFRIPSTFGIKMAQPRSSQDQTQTELAQLGQKVVEFVEKNFDDVGCDFAKEALKMHYGISEPRNIRGVSSEEEEKTLKDEGIEFFKFPMPQSTKPDT
jgi:hypothetical protein